MVFKRDMVQINRIIVVGGKQLETLSSFIWELCSQATIRLHSRNEAKDQPGKSDRRNASRMGQQ